MRDVPWIIDTALSASPSIACVRLSLRGNHDKLVTIPARLKVEETQKFVKNRKSKKLLESTQKMDENRSCRSTAMGYEKGFYKKLVNPDN
uniref:Uncharacterized protein n=1 Tax=Romanomermis culicivorax TaxID=13658 RepID=A0A915L2U2_ROMCU